MSEKCKYNVIVWCLFVAVSVASVVGAQCDGPVDTFLQAQGGHPATPTVSGCGYIIVGVTIWSWVWSMPLLVGHYISCCLLWCLCLCMLVCVRVRACQ